MQSETIVTIVKKLFEHANPDNNKFTETTQYNIRVDGEVEKSFVFKMKDLEVVDGPVDDADVDITIDDGDFVKLFKGEATLEALLTDDKIDVSGDKSLLKVIDDGRTESLAKLKELADAAKE